MAFNNATEETRYQCVIQALKHSETQSAPVSITELIENAGTIEKFITEGQAE